ncbi:MAG: cytochrome c [Ignavibacteria bacterium]|nr:cytochrome c [Ignavibacteria bacterium]
MKFITVSFTILLQFVLLVSSSLQAQSGEEIFKLKCSPCHTIGKGKLVGPDLSGVTKRREEAWLMKFIKSSQTVVNSGDENAKKIFEEFNKVVMPDPGLSDPEIKKVLTYIESQGGSVVSETIVSKIRPLSEATPDNYEKGKKLFSGELRLVNDGAPCVSCHNIPEVTALGGGNLALDLTHSFSKLSEGGLTNIIQTQPFPVMNMAFVNNPITDEEVFDIAAYLKGVDAANQNVQQTNQPINFLYSGIGGLFLLLFVFGGLWHNRRKRSVNFEIYKRQEDYIRKNS